MTLESILAKTNLPVKYEDKLKSFVENVQQEDAVAGVLLFGSAAKGEFDEFSDIDVIVFTNGGGFKTPEKVYEIVADNYFKPLTVQIKSLNEISGANQVTMDVGFLEHLNNVGLMLSDKTNLEFSSALNSKTFGRHAAYIWYDLYRVRKDFLLFNYVRRGLDEAKKHIHSTTPTHFFQQAVRRVLGVPLTPEQDNKSEIIKIFYEKTNLPAPLRTLKELREKDRDAKTYDDYSQFKNMIEEAIWALNCYMNLNSQT